ncbi:hypothetical protein [uncultured Pontibacter sp.]|uniref:hypothetical protein n=1 Tax=uncultured Pontibacter sp. TaxID=453356 RepID=UPI002617DE99|nr:hypothetical protein [uncultured Pontibacter sp.]
MKTKLTLLVLTLCLCRFAHAQTADSSTYKHSLGIIASPTLNKLFENNSSLPIGLIYKRQHKANTAIRATLSGRFDQSAHDTEQPLKRKEASENRGSYLQLTGGYEWQMPLGNRWQLYYGAEAGPSYGKSTYEFKSDQVDYYNSSKYSSEYSYTNYGVLLRPFAGVTFQLSKKLVIATETAIIGVYSHSENTSKQLVFDDNNRQTTNADVTYITYKPLSNISLQVRF